MKNSQPIIIKKVKGSHEAHHGGSWKVAYADFVTAMMAFFMVMWIMGLSDNVRTLIQGYFNDPVGFMKSIPRSTNLIKTMGHPAKVTRSTSPAAATHLTGEPGSLEIDLEELEAIKREIQKKLATTQTSSLKELTKNVEITMVKEGLLIEFIEKTGEVFFKVGSAEIQPKARNIFLEISKVLAKSERKLILDGHTDARPYPSSTYDNWDLSADRAIALKKILLEGGAPPEQILKIRAYAATKLRNPADPYHFSNRRVTILLPFKSGTNAITNLPKDRAKLGVHTPFLTIPKIQPSSTSKDRLSTPTLPQTQSHQDLN
jgi:chemotaxis protein MotB